MKTNRPKTSPQKKRKAVSDDAVTNQAITTELMRFIEYHPPERFRKNLRKMLFEFLMSDGAVESSYLKDLLYDLDGLFELLDAIEAADRDKVE